MKIGQGRIIEVRQQKERTREVVVSLEGLSHPTAGQFFQVNARKDRDRPVGITLFPVGMETDDPEAVLFSCSGGIPDRWVPGDRLGLYGPLGKGFDLPAEAGKLALAAVGETSSYLLPLAAKMLEMGGEVALFTKGSFPTLPARVEVNPLSSLPDAVYWADFLAIAISAEELDLNLKLKLGIDHPSCPAQVLALGQFPCAGLGTCGVCAIKTSGRRIIYACQDGPVFDWKEF